MTAYSVITAIAKAKALLKVVLLVIGLLGAALMGAQFILATVKVVRCYVFTKKANN